MDDMPFYFISIMIGLFLFLAHLVSFRSWEFIFNWLNLILVLIQAWCLKTFDQLGPKNY